MSKSLYSVTENPLTGGGIFTALQTLNPPWADEDIAAQLDLIYYGNVSGCKLISPLVERLMTGSKLSEVETATLASALMATNGNRWAREWATRSAQYDPIENYRMTEELKDDETITEYGRHDTRTDNLQHGETRTDNLAHSETRTDNLAHTETRTDDLAHSETRTDNLAHSETRTDDLAHSETRTDNLAHSETRTDNLTRTIDNQEITTPNTTTTRQQSTRGFNSSADVNTDKETTTNTGTNRVDTDGTEHNTGTQGTTGSNTGTQATQGTNTGTVGVSGSNTGTQSTQGSNTGTQATQGTNTGTVGVSGSNTGTQSTQGTDTGTQTNAASGSDTSTRNYQLTRSGNIGVTTSQQMLQSERDLWMWSFFYDVVFPDVDTVLTIPIYADSDDADGTGGGIIPTGTINIVSNGVYDVTYRATANVAVPNTYTESDEWKVVVDGQLVSQYSGDILTNGIHDTRLLGSVSVQVSNTYTEADEGKVVSGGALVDQTGPLDVTENGLIDTTTIASVNVNVPPEVLTGTEPPAESVGVNGTYYYQRSDESDIITAYTGTVSGSNTNVYGIEFVPVHDVVVTSLMGLTTQAKTGKLRIGTLDTVLAEVSATFPAGEWVNVPLETPLTLTAGTHYIVQTVIDQSVGSIAFLSSVNQIGYDPEVQYIQSRYGGYPGLTESNSGVLVSFKRSLPYYLVIKQYLKVNNEWTEL